MNPYSREDQRRAYVYERPVRNDIHLGDRVFARLCINGKVLIERIFDSVADMSQLVRELRFHTRRCRGLARLYVRNLSRGWSVEKPLMLYPGVFEPEMGEVPVQRQRMLFPWETH